MARTSLGTWEERLEELRRQADPEMDQLVHRYYQDHQELEDVRSLVLQMLSELGEAKRNPAAEPATTVGQAGDRLSALLDPPPLPPWARDEARITRDQAVFADRGCTSRRRCSSPRSRWRTRPTTARRRWSACRTWPPRT
jgi:hypothetical protein